MLLFKSGIDPRSRFLFVLLCGKEIPDLSFEGFEDPDSGWPRVLRRFAAEAWRREDAGELADAELYRSDAQWCGIYDRMARPTAEATARRQHLAMGLVEV